MYHVVKQARVGMTSIGRGTRCGLPARFSTAAPDGIGLYDRKTYQPIDLKNVCKTCLKAVGLKG